MIQTSREYSIELLKELIDDYKEKELPRFERLADYYDAKSDITQRVLEEGKPNNKTVLNYPAYIVDMIAGYMVGVPVSYTTQNENTELMELVQDVFHYNDERDENTELAKMMGTKGVAYELIYADEDAEIRFNELEPDGAFLVYDNKITPKPRFGVRFYTIDEVENVEVYFKEDIYRYTTGDDGNYSIFEEDIHYFGDVPLIPYYNNKKKMGDFEKVITLIDAIELASSNSVNDLEYFSDAYLCLVGMMGTEKEDISNIRTEKVILLEEKGEASFLVKPSNNKDSEDVKDRLHAQIHKFAGVPDMGDENFAQNSSGVAMGYKHFMLDQIVANKKHKFQTGLTRRLELICNFLNQKAGVDKYNYLDIRPAFTSNKPINEKENVEIAKMLKGIVSEQRAIAYLSMVDDPSDELERIQAERDAYPSYFSDMDDEPLTESDDG